MLHQGQATYNKRELNLYRRLQNLRSLLQVLHRTSHCVMNFQPVVFDRIITDCFLNTAGPNCRGKSESGMSCTHGCN